MNSIQQDVTDYLAARGWDKLAPADLAKSVMIEGAELLELFQWDNYTVSQIEKDKALKTKIEQEMADVMIYCTELAIRLGVDIETVMREKLEHNARKYPAEKMMQHKGEKTAESFYLQRKMEYRRKGK